MNNYRKYESNPITFKRIARASFGMNRHAVVSLANNDTLTLGQQMVTQQEDGVKYIPVTCALHIHRNNLFALHNLLTWVLLHMSSKDVPSESMEYINKLRAVSSEEMKKIEDDMRRIGFPPTNFNGQSYHFYNQTEESPPVKRNS